MKHKWHKEIKAWADGKTIEQRYTNRNANYDNWESVPNPMWIDEVCEYRIKPQPKEPQYLYVYATSKGYQFALKHGAVEVGSLNEIANCIGKIKLEVDD